MAKGKLALDALEALLSGVKRVDIGDVTRPVTGARLEALQKMLPKVADKADDWGWKGGKPGEVTGTDYMSAYDVASREAKEVASRIMGKRADPGNYQTRDWYERTLEKNMRKLYDAADEQLSNTRNAGVSEMRLDSWITPIMQDFAILEAAGIPREWTGKVLPAIAGSIEEAYDSVPPIVAKQVSDLMRPLTNDQRETFLSLLPEWSGSLDELAETARSL